mgnify:CR=1 FL=1
MNGALTAADIAAAVGGECLGDANRPVARIGALEGAGDDTVSFLAQPRLRPLLHSTQAGTLIVRADDAQTVQARGATAIVVDDPYRAYAALTRWWAARLRPSSAGAGLLWSGTPPTRPGRSGGEDGCRLAWWWRSP